MSKNLTSELNPGQKEAVLHTKGPLMVLAGAGSGKTRIITCRFANLVKKASPCSVLAVTYTNRAADEMRSGIAGQVGKDLKQCWIGTFHSQCVRILRKEISALGYSPDFSIYGDEDQLNLIRHILKDLNLYEALYKGVLSKISNLKSSLIEPKEFVAKSDGFGFEERLAKVYMRYQDELRKSNALDFDDLVMLVIKLFENEPAVLDRYRKMFEHILVDELQDTNPAQYKLLKLLARPQGNICVAGDDDQSICRLRGGELNNMLNFENDFPGAKVIRLDQSYRCTQKILDVSGGIVSKNSKRMGKDLQAKNGQGEDICFFWLNSEEEEARHIARMIREFFLKNTYGYGDFAVLYRINSQSRALEDRFQSEGIPFKVMGGVSFYQRKEIKDLAGYLKLVVNKDDNVALRRIINCPPRGIGASTLSKVEQNAKKKSLSLYASIKGLLKANGLMVTMKEKLESFISLMEGLSSRRYKDAAELLKAIVESTGYMTDLDEPRAENVKEFIASAAGKDVKEFADKLSLASGSEESSAEGHVRLITLHCAKGLEFPVVFVAGMEEGLLPYFKAKAPEELAEERRLLYVGMTRARDILILTGARKRRLFDKLKEQKPSRFLQDIPKSCYKTIEKAPPQAARKEEVFRPAPAPLPYVTGTRVKHSKWGVGIVRDCYGEGDDAKVTVNFPSIGLKKLNLKFAHLEKIH